MVEVLSKKAIISTFVTAIDKYYVFIMSLIAILVIRLNFHAQGMQGIIPNYLDFKRIILAGFDPSAALYGTPTFPMWGYGWLFLITENKLLLLVFQNALALFAAWFFIGYLEKNNILRSKSVWLLKFLLVISIPWYAFHSLMWPYSVSISLFLISFALFANSFSSDEIQIGRIVLSGVLFGLALNFRSDYYMMPIGFAIIALAFAKFNIVTIKKAAVWILSVYILLLPWAIYSKHVTGHYLLTSTNTGHVLFIGLGNLPNNKWGITQYDEDPLMHDLIKERFGEKKSSFVYEADRFLRAEFMRRVKEDPREYIRKCLYSLRSMLTQGVYRGEFYESPDCYPNCLSRWKGMGRKFLSNPITFFRNNGLDGILYLLQAYSNLFGRLVILLSFVLFLFIAVVAFRRKNLFFIFLLSAIAYQSAINVFAYHVPIYTANMYFFHLINLNFGVLLLTRYISTKINILKAMK
ncbi:MAG: hypothetical protein ACUVXI_14035 [bacterium]